jgi:hypothetical protein
MPGAQIAHKPNTRRALTVPAVADMAEIAAVLDRRGALEPGGPQFLLDVPMRPAQSLGGSKNDTARTSSAAYR